MKHIQGTFITGYVTIQVNGYKPEMFFQECIEQGVQVWNVIRISENACKGNVKLRDINIIKKVKRRTNYKITFIDKKGYPFLINHFIKRKELLFALLMSILLILFLSNIIWKVNITGVSKEMEEKISKELDHYGIHSGSWVFTLDSPNTIQKKLIKDLPGLLWVGVHKKGTTFILEGVEKTIVEKKEVHGPRDLIATKKGIINKIYVSKGIPKVRVNEYVEPGDVLVSGYMSEQEEITDEKSAETDTPKLVAAEGDITANTWYEISVTIPLKASYELLTGNQEKMYYLRVGNIQIPIWSFGAPNYQDFHNEIHTNPIYLFKWKLPINIVESIFSEKMYNKVNRTKEEAINVGITQAKQELQLQLGSDAHILSEKVLHETTENGKVKLTLYITVEEDIAQAKPINQGD